MDPWSSPFTGEVSDGGAVLDLGGDFEEMDLPEMLELLAPLQAHGGTVRLSELTFITSRAVSALAMASQEATRAGVRITLVAKPGSIAAAVLNAVGLEFDPDLEPPGPRPQR